MRRFIAKGERISDYGIDAIARIEDWCNNLLRKIQGYKTPDELFEAKLDEIYSALLGEMCNSFLQVTGKILCLNPRQLY